jgi:choline dehydrogenase-like flavoprotein
LEGASQRGLQVLCDTEIINLKIENGKVVGAIGKHKDGHEIIIHAKYIVLAAGAIHSPTILLRSKLRHVQLGKNLFLHPTVVSSAIYDQKINTWFGPMMSTVIDDYAHINDHYGFKVETAPFHPGFASVVVPFKNSIQFKTDMLALSRMAHFVALVRDKNGGKIEVNAQGRPIINYKVHKADLKTIQKGTKAIIKLHHKAGAVKIFHPNLLAQSFVPEDQKLSQYFNSIESLSWKANQFMVGSAHQMGTCRMSGDRKKGVTKPDGESWLANNLFIADASLFPTASGVNPMVSIQALAYHVAKNIP